MGDFRFEIKVGHERLHAAHQPGAFEKSLIHLAANGIPAIVVHFYVFRRLDVTVVVAKIRPRKRINLRRASHLFERMIFVIRYFVERRNRAHTPLVKMDTLIQSVEENGKVSSEAGRIGQDETGVIVEIFFRRQRAAGFFPVGFHQQRCK